MSSSSKPGGNRSSGFPGRSISIPPSARVTSSSPASDELIALRIQHLLPSSTQRAERRLGELRQLFLAPRELVHQAHRQAVSQYIEELQPLKCVRNVKVESASGLHEQHCYPFTACAAMPYRPSLILTGAFDGLVTLWNTETCKPEANRVVNAGSRSLWSAGARAPAQLSEATTSACINDEDDSEDSENEGSSGGGGYGAVRSIATHPTAPIFFTSSMFDTFVRGWKVEDVSNEGSDDDHHQCDDDEEEEGGRRTNQRNAGPSHIHPWVRFSPHAAAAASVRSLSSQPSTTLIRSLAVDPTGRLLAGAGGDGKLRLWDVESGALNDTLATTNGSSINASSSWSAQPATRYGALPPPTADGIVSNAAAAASTTSTTMIKRQRRRHPLHIQEGYERVGSTHDVKFHPDGALLSSSDAGGRIVTWDLRCGKVAFQTTVTRILAASGRQSHRGTAVGGGGHLGPATCLAWSPCGVRFASGGADAVVQLWDARQLHKASLSFSSSPSFADAQGREEENQAADDNSNSIAAPYHLVGHDDVITSLSFRTCPPGLFLHQNQRQPAADASSLAYSSSIPTVLGRLLPLALVTTSLDKTIRLWDMNTGVCVKTLEAEGPVRSHCWLNGGSQDGSLVTIVHGKSWSLWGCGGEGVATQVMETAHTVVRDDNNGSGSHIAEHSTGGQGDEDEDEAGEEEDEDEMAALRKGSASPITTQNAVSMTRDTKKVEDDDEDEEEDEMAALWRI